VAEAFRADLFAPAGLTRWRRRTPSARRHRWPPPRRLHLTASDGYLPCRAVASSGADTMAGIAADPPTLARWGYQLYGARLLPLHTVQAMITQQNASNVFPGIGYDLGTQLFSGLATDATVGHIGESPGLYEHARGRPCPSLVGGYPHSRGEQKRSGHHEKPVCRHWLATRGHRQQERHPSLAVLDGLAAQLARAPQGVAASRGRRARPFRPRGTVGMTPSRPHPTHSLTLTTLHIRTSPRRGRGGLHQVGPQPLPRPGHMGGTRRGTRTASGARQRGRPTRYGQHSPEELQADDG
jgi:hypothetical protein